LTDFSITPGLLPRQAGTSGAPLVGRPEKASKFHELTALQMLDQMVRVMPPANKFGKVYQLEN